VQAICQEGACVPQTSSPQNPNEHCTIPQTAQSIANPTAQRKTILVLLAGHHVRYNHHANTVKREREQERREGGREKEIDRTVLFI